MPRPRWTPPNDEVAERIDATEALFRQWQEVEAAYKAAITSLTSPDGDEVPVTYMAKRLGVERKTIYRHTGRSMT